LLVYLAAITALFLLYFLRLADDNRLTRWAWVFEGNAATRIYFPALGGAALAYLLSCTRFIEDRPAAWLFVISFATSAFFWKEPELIVDASRYFTQAKHLELYGAGYFIREWGRAVPAWTDMPLVPFLYGLLFKFFGEARIFVQVLTTTLFSLTVVLTYRTATELWDNREAGLYAGLFLLGVPYVYTQVPLMLADIPSTFFFTLSVYTFVVAIKRGGIRIPLAALALFAAFLSKYSIWLMLTTPGVVLAVYLFSPETGATRIQSNGRKYRMQCLLRAGSIMLLSASLAGAVFLYMGDVLTEQMRFLIDFQSPGLKRWGESLVSTFLFQIHPFFTGAAVLSLFVAIRRRDARVLITLWPIMLLLALQVKRIRYTLPALPLLAVAASYGLFALRDRETRRFVALCAASCSIMLALFAYAPLMQRMNCVNLKQAGDFLNSIPQKDVEVYIAPYAAPVLNPAVDVPILDLFTRKNILYNYEPEQQPSSEEVAVSPLRFTWEYKNPVYYRYNPAQLSGSAVVVIAGEAGKSLPDKLQQRTKHFHFSKEFTVSDDMFMHQTLVTVYY
jgi:hypothetical protein